MNIKIGSVFGLSMDILPQKDIRRFRFKIMPFIIRKLEIGDLFRLTSGITYIKILSDPISEITPKIKVDIRRISVNELLESDLSNLEEFFPHAKGQKASVCKDNSEYFIATRDKELISLSAVGYARRGRLMISGTKTLERFRGNHISPAVLGYLMKYLRDIKKIDRVYISTNGTNISSQKGILRAGFKIDFIFYDLFLCKGRIRPIQFLRNLLKRS